jgi:hypothetical protein
MLGKVIRAAAGFAGAMLVATAIMVVSDVLVSPICSQQGAESLLCQSFSAGQTWFPVLVLIGIAIGLIARGVVEADTV